MDNRDEHTTESTAEPILDTKKDKKMAQLAAARASAVTKKRQRDDDISMMKETLNNLSSLLANKKEEKVAEEDEPVQAKKKGQEDHKGTRRGCGAYKGYIMDDIGSSNWCACCPCRCKLLFQQRLWEASSHCSKKKSVACSAYSSFA